jgi:predicted permease
MPAVYLPFRIDRSSVIAGQFNYYSLARLAQGFTLEAAMEDLAPLIPRAIENFPGGITLADAERFQLRPHLQPLRDDVIGDVGTTLRALLGTSAVVLLMVCVNVANLSLAHAERRDREFAVKSALGASHGRIAGQLFAESLVLGVGAGLLALGLAGAGVGAIKATSAGVIPRLYAVGLDLPVILFTTAVALASGLLIGLFSVVRLRGIDLAEALRAGRGGLTPRRVGRWTRTAMAAGQVAMALVLLIGMGLLAKTYSRLSGVDPGVGDPDALLTFAITIPSGDMEDLEEAARTHEIIAERLTASPEVSSVGLTSKLPMGYSQNVNPVFVEGRPPPAGTAPPGRQYTWAGGDYFRAIGISILAGRALSWEDIRHRTPVVVISESLAREYWGNPGSAVGERISPGPEPGRSGWREIVGVAGGVLDDGPNRGPTDIVYWPMVTPHPWAAEASDSTWALRTMSYAVRGSRSGTPPPARVVRDVVRSVDPDFALNGVRTMKSLFAEHLETTTFTLLMLAMAAAVALCLGIIGVYSVISYLASQETSETGVRLVLGATPGDVMRHYLGHGLLVSCGGVAIGLGVALVMTRVIGALLFGVGPADPVTYGAMAIGLTAATMAASFLPARRASTTDLMRTIRME